MVTNGNYIYHGKKLIMYIIVKELFAHLKLMHCMSTILQIKKKSSGITQFSESKGYFLLQAISTYKIFHNNALLLDSEVIL